MTIRGVVEIVIVNRDLLCGSFLYEKGITRDPSFAPWRTLGPSSVKQQSSACERTDPSGNEKANR